MRGGAPRHPAGHNSRQDGVAGGGEGIVEGSNGDEDKVSEGVGAQEGSGREHGYEAVQG